MKTDPADALNDELRPEYTEADLKNSVRGKYAERLRQNTALIALEPDVATVFHDAATVNAALRFLMKLTQENPLTAPQQPTS